MAIAANGPNGEHHGKLGNLVYYMLNGKNVSRRIGRSTKPPTEAQLNARAKTKMSSEFLSIVQDFITLGFGVEAAGTNKNAFNIAVSCNKKNMLQGAYPNLEILYSEIQLSKGNLLPAQNPQVALTAAGLEFNWDTDPKMKFPEATDQAMLLAYFPEKKKAVFTLFGADRLSGTALLPIPESLMPKHMETYISFVSADRKQLANSIYTGHFNK